MCVPANRLRAAGVDNLAAVRQNLQMSLQTVTSRRLILIVPVEHGLPARRAAQTEVTVDVGESTEMEIKKTTELLVDLVGQRHIENPHRNHDIVPYE